MTHRLGPQPGELIDRERPVSFSWNGRTHHGYAGDTIASALAADGVRVFSRSFKYHRRRGLLTADHLDPGCIVSVDDEPNVRGAHRRVQPGMVVRSQDTWPSLRLDLKAANQAVGRFLSAGFYYKTFMRPRALWPVYEAVLRRFSHGGAVPARPAADGAASRPAHRHAHPDVLVAGGGSAGMTAALAAAEAGAQVLLVEEQPELGGRLQWGGADELARLATLRARVAHAPGIEVLSDSVVLGRYDGNWVAVLQRGPTGGDERLVKARAKSLVVAPGLVERPYVFAGNDLPGVLLSGAVRRLVNLYAVRPGERAVVLTANGSGDAAVADLVRAGVRVVHVADARRGDDVVRAVGRGRVQAVDLTDGRRVACDLLVTAVGWTAPLALLTMAGGTASYDPRAARFRPDLASLPSDVLATGRLVGDGTPAERTAHAEMIGAAAAERAASRAARWRGQPTPSVARVEVPPPPADSHPELVHGRTHGFVDLSEDVTSPELVAAVAEGYDSVELAKRYTTATMGPTQGKLESVNTAAIVAEVTGRTLADTGTTTWRPPYLPVTLGALAGPLREPLRRSPMQSWHDQHGAVPLQAGAWVRPDHYGDPTGEALAVRQAVGIIDVTPIGKLDLRGPDVARLLELLYVNRWAKLAVGRVRYGVMCAEDGVVLDDGVTGRLGEQHYLMTTTSSGAATVWEWAEAWLQTEHPDWQVHITPVTTAYASINVAGPRARDLVRRVTDVDLSAEAFGYLHVRTGRVADVPECVLWRIGFTGELSYELHVPAGYGRHVWETLIARGHDLGVRPFGVEAQRILRLEKGHLIVGQDTDGLTTGVTAGLDGLVRLEKDDFVGRPELAWQAAAGDAHHRLVGLRPVDGVTVPAEGSQLVAAGRVVGRVTSARWSPTLGRPVCLGQVPGRLARPGTAVTVRLAGGSAVTATVTESLAQVDPAGERLRA